jgi:hypothetical protein
MSNLHFSEWIVTAYARKTERQVCSEDAVLRAVDEVPEGYIGYKERLLHSGYFRLHSRKRKQ